MHNQRFFDRLTTLARVARRHPAIVSADLSLNYGGLHACVGKTISALHAFGIKAGDVVGITLKDEVDHLIVSLALLSTGASQITLASFEDRQAHAGLSKFAEVTKVISAEEHKRFFKREWLESAVDYDPGPPPPGATGMLLLRTSGTTGESNIVPFSEGQIALQAERHRDYADERLLRLASIEHNNSKRHRLYCVWAGGTNVFRPVGSMDLVDFVLKQAVTCLDISIVHAVDIAALADAQKLGDVKLRTGGSAIPFEIRRKILERVTPILFVRYATTESGAIAMACPADHDRLETVGKPYPDVRLEIVDDEGSPLSTRETGNIRLKAPGTASAYLNSPQQSSARFRDGWFYPGDLGYLLADGRLVIQGRRDDMINLNGINIFPAEIERMLTSHPDVKHAAALALPSSVHGQIPVAAVELVNGATASAIDLKKYTRQRMGIRFPRRVAVLDTLPRNGQNKILKKELLRYFEVGENRT